MLRFLFVFSVPTFSSYNPDIAKKGASPGGVTPLRWRARGPNQGGKSTPISCKARVPEMKGLSLEAKSPLSLLPLSLSIFSQVSL